MGHLARIWKMRNASTAFLGQTKEGGTEGPDIDGSIILSDLNKMDCVSE